MTVNAPEAWFGWSPVHGWVVLDRTEARNKNSIRVTMYKLPLWEPLTVLRSDWTAPDFVWCEKALTVLNEADAAEGRRLIAEASEELKRRHAEELEARRQEAEQAVARAAEELELRMFRRAEELRIRQQDTRKARERTRQQTSERHKRYLESHGYRYRGYDTHLQERDDPCWNCKWPSVTVSSDVECGACGWIACPECGACGCGRWR